MLLTLKIFVLLICTVFTTCARLLLSPAYLDRRTYDFVIVGAGTAGNVLANRLSASPSTNVLVVEAGISNKVNNLNIVVPFLGFNAEGSPFDWNYTTVPQPGLNNRTVPVPRGFVLGGSSSINLMTWTRGSDDIWDNWANMTDVDGWSWESVKQYYLETSRLVPPADGHNTSGEVDPSSHGTGPVEVSLPGFPTVLDERVINASKSLGGRFSFTEDLNAGTSLGFSYMQSTVGFGERSSSATAYLEPALHRPNLDVLITTRVTKLLADTNASLPSFKTVEIAQGANGTHYYIYATKEIILCGGAIGTPQLLLLSGIGPKHELASLGIPTVLDLPDVGKHLADHPLVANYYEVNSTETFDDVFRNSTLFNKDLAEWNTSRQGLFVDTPSNTIGFLRLPDTFVGDRNPASGALAANTELLFSDAFFALGDAHQPATGNFISVLTAVVSPTSRGTLTLRSADPFVHPAIDLGLLTTDFDVSAMIRAMKDAESFIGSSAWKKFIIGPFGDLANATTDTAKENLIRNNAQTVFHPVGTARMSPKHAIWGVTDPDLLVKGTTGLRIVDASIFPQIPECHPQALVYTLAERAADLIKAFHGIGH